jgi:hypothetical protein
VKKKKFHLGKKKATYDHRDLMMARYLDLSKLPPLPDNFGSEGLVGDWGMYGNDNCGDCVWAGAAHETMLWSRIGAAPDAVFNDTTVLSDYTALTGFDPNDPATDQGTDMHEAMNYRRNIGILDANGVRHKIAAYVWLEPGNLQQLYYATYLFKAAGIGIQFPDSAMDQFNKDLPWAVVGGSQVNGGHYIPAIAKRANNIMCVSWSKPQLMTPAFYTKFNDETAAMISEEFLTNGKSPEGFDLPTLIRDLGMIQK